MNGELERKMKNRGTSECALANVSVLILIVIDNGSPRRDPCYVWPRNGTSGIIVVLLSASTMTWLALSIHLKSSVVSSADAERSAAEDRVSR